MTTPPSCEAELLERARALAGRTVGEVARGLGVALPPNTRRAKGVVGQLAERALGASAGSLDEPDFREIGVELKTLPVRPDGRPKESTFVCTIRLTELPEIDFEDSLAWKKIRRVLFLPVEAASAVPLARRRFGAPLLWSPAPQERAVLQEDYERVATLVLRGEVERVTGHLGTYLQVRPKAADSRARRTAPDDDDGFLWTGPRGFYLRTALTRRVLATLR